MQLVTNRNVPKREKVFERFTVNIGGDGIKPEVVKLEGRKHLKVPAVIINEGVLDGSHGPGFYPAEENGKRVTAWNHMPITLDHPTVKGKRVSARHPKVINRFKVGVFLNAKQEGTKTKGFAYLDVGRTRQLDARVLRRLQKGKKVEVSTGLSVRQEFKKGVHNNKKYEWIARDQEPDHLAVLVDSVGACSIKDGAGLLANEAKVPESVSTVLRKSVEELVKGIGVEKIVGNEMSFSQVSMHLSNALSSAYGKPGQYWRGYVVEVFPDSVVYYGEDGKLYRVGYKTTKTTVELTGDAVVVARQVEYVPVSNSTSSEEVANMASFDKKAHVKSLIGNGFEESDKTWLLKLDDEQLRKIRPRKKKEKQVDNSDQQSKKTKPEAATPPAKMTWEEIEALIPPSKRAAMEFGEQTITNQRQQAKEIVKKSKGNKLTDEQLDKLPFAVLVNMASMATVEKETKKTVEPDPDDVFANEFNPNFFNFSGVPGSFGVVNEVDPDTDDDDEEDEEEKTPSKKKVVASNTTKKACGPRKWSYPNRIGSSSN